MGRPKLMLPLGDGSVLSHVLDTAVASPLDEVIVVLGPDADGVRSALGDAPTRVRFVTNPDHRKGQSTSLGVGLRSCDRTSAAAVVLLGDQPGVSPAAVAAVVAAFTEAGATVPEVVQASYGGRPAHPTLLARSIWDEVVGEGDLGARGWIADHPDRRSLVELGGAPPADVDTPEDYERLRPSFEP